VIRRFCSPDILNATFHHARGINPTIFPNSNEGSEDVRVCGSRWAVFTREKVVGLEGRPLAAVTNKERLNWMIVLRPNRDYI